MEMMTWSSVVYIPPPSAALQDAFDGVRQTIGTLSLRLSFPCPWGQPQMALGTAGIFVGKTGSVQALHLM